MQLRYQIELQNSTAFSVHEIERGTVYELRKCFNYEKLGFFRKEFLVSVDREENKFQCMCRCFERDGLLCGHILRLFTQFDILAIPDQYIVDRWTIEYRERELAAHDASKRNNSIIPEGEDSAKIALRYSLMMSKIAEACSDICNDAKESRRFMDTIELLHDDYMKKARRSIKLMSQSHQLPTKIQQ